MYSKKYALEVDYALKSVRYKNFGKKVHFKANFTKTLSNGMKGFGEDQLNISF